MTFRSLGPVHRIVLTFVVSLVLITVGISLVTDDPQWHTWFTAIVASVFTTAALTLARPRGDRQG